MSLRTAHRAQSHLSSPVLIQARWRSTSPYGRSHLRKLPALPPPVVPIFKQRVILSDGSTFVHTSTSPRSIVRLTRDLTNNPFWAPSSTDLSFGDDEAGRMGRFKRRFGDSETGGGSVGFDQVTEGLEAGVQTTSEAVQKAQKAGVGGKWRWVGGVDTKKKK